MSDICQKFGEFKLVKKYTVRLSDEERAVCEDIVKNLKGPREKFKRAQILLQADENGPKWKDAQIAEAYKCRIRSIEAIRQRLVLNGFEETLNGKKKDPSAWRKVLDGEQEAKLIAMRLGSPPEGYGRWSLRLLRDQAVELSIVESISHETIRQMLKKKSYYTTEHKILGYAG